MSDVFSIHSPIGPSDAGGRRCVGLIGLDDAGLFHVERLSLRSDFAVVAACDPSTGAIGGLPAPHAGASFYSRVEDLLARSDVATVLISGSTDRRVNWAHQALTAGKDVAIEPPPCVDAGQMGQLLAAASRTGARLSILPSRRGTSEFLTAMHVVRSGGLGSLVSARLLSWAKAVPAGRARQGAPDPFAFFAYQYVDQLLQLIAKPPRSLFARIAPTPVNEPDATVFVLSIAFEPGVDALIDVNLNCGAVSQTGWILAGTRGGYSSGKIYVEEPSGEIWDAPVEQTELPKIDVYGELLEMSQAARGRMASAREAEVVLRVIDAARESSRTGQTVAIEQ